MRQVGGGKGGRAYEIDGLAYVERFDGSHFVLRGEAIRWETVPPEAIGTRPFQAFEEVSRLTKQVRRLRGERFGIAVRKAYPDRCSLCEGGYRGHRRVLGFGAAHIIPVRDRGTAAGIPDRMLLCPKPHVLFDQVA